MRFEWDDGKSQSNEKKHGVAFEEARSVFYEENALLYDDPDHSEVEQRFLLLGPAPQGVPGGRPLLPGRRRRDPGHLGPKGNPA